jgi:hypothetical protein
LDKVLLVAVTAEAVVAALTVLQLLPQVLVERTAEAALVVSKGRQKISALAALLG